MSFFDPLEEFAIKSPSSYIILSPNVNALTLSSMAGFQTHISKCSEMGVKLNFLIFFSWGHPQQKGLKGQEFTGMGAS